MNPIQFTGLNTNVNIASTDDNRKKAIKRAAVGTAIVGTAVIGSTLIYKNRNSKQVKKAIAIVKENVLEPLNKKAAALKEKAKEAFGALRAKIDDVKTRKAENKPVPDLKKNQDNIAPAVKNAKKQNAPKKAKKAKKTNNTKKALSGNIQKSKKRVVDLAKDNAGKLRVAAAGLGTGAVAGAAGAGAVSKVNEVSKDGLEKGKKLILTSDGQEFKGYFKNGKAYNEDNTLLNDKLTYVYSAGTKQISTTDEDGQMGMDEKRDIRKTIMTYQDGILRKATYFSDIDVKIPTFIKHYDENGKVINEYNAFSATGEKGKLTPGEIFDYGVVQNPNLSKTPVLLKKHIIKEDGTDVYKFYKKNVDENGAVKGKPIYVFSSETKTLENGNIRTGFYAPDPKGRGADFLVKTIVKRPDGITKISMMTRDEGVYGGPHNVKPINGYAKSILTLDKDGRAVSFKVPLSEGNGSLDGLIRLRGGKILSINDESHFVNIGYPIGTAVQWAPFRFSFPDENDKFSDEIYTLHDLTTRVGIKYYEDGQTVKSIANYRDFCDFPDSITYFDRDGRPVQDVAYTGVGEDTIFTPKYVFTNPLPTLSDDIQGARNGILRFETRIHAKASEEARRAVKEGKQTAAAAKTETHTSA